MVCSLCLVTIFVVTTKPSTHSMFKCQSLHVWPLLKYFTMQCINIISILNHRYQFPSELNESTIFNCHTIVCKNNGTPPITIQSEPKKPIPLLSLLLQHKIVAVHYFISALSSLEVMRQAKFHFV